LFLEERLDAFIILVQAIMQGACNRAHLAIPLQQTSPDFLINRSTPVISYLVDHPASIMVSLRTFRAFPFIMRWSVA
jgi:hypothetical protein